MRKTQQALAASYRNEEVTPLFRQTIADGCGSFETTADNQKTVGYMRFIKKR
jgi:hypothetical protein